MHKLTKIAGIGSIVLLLVGCQSEDNNGVNKTNEPVSENTSENDSAPSEDENKKDSHSENKSVNTMDDSNSDNYTESRASKEYFINTHIYDASIEFLTAYSIDRNDNEQLSNADRLIQSLIKNDPSEQSILESFADLAMEGTKLEINFSEDGNNLSATSAQSMLFYDSLFGISDLYGVEEIVFHNTDGELDVTLAERLIDEPIRIEDERSQTRGYYAIYDKDLEQSLFLPGGQLGEQLANENGELLSFPQTLEAMRSVKSEDTFYSSVIVEGLKITDATYDSDVATVQYTMDEDLVTESDRIVFENAVQLAALDFHALEVKLKNETLQEENTYPLINL